MYNVEEMPRGNSVKNFRVRRYGTGKEPFRNSSVMKRQML
jgi:hypothetical protein